MTEIEVENLRIGDRVRLKKDITAALAVHIPKDCAQEFAGNTVTVKKIVCGCIEIAESIIGWWFPPKSIECVEEKQGK